MPLLWMFPKRGFRFSLLMVADLKGFSPLPFWLSGKKPRGRRVGDSFDLISGTSTGGIIALALGLGRTAQEILQFYLDHGEAIFPPETFEWIGQTRQATGSRYRPESLEKVLREYFGAATLGDSGNRLLIPAYHADKGDIYLFKTAHHPRLRMDYRELMSVVALSTGRSAHIPTATATSGWSTTD